ncbi:MAG TPA: ABC transporter ATP-binding protein [Anaerolineaceae bacterium]|nr:ABC transporter ATP-binding protein [Anaerolineaceae bacterium]HPN50944.1 ABC transporter ATP-binding protein [Anaerolineaceae bacterium]
MTLNEAQPIISLIGVKKAYRTPAGDFYALKGIDAQIRRGEFVGIWGKSGAGKSTLVNMISGVDHLTSGEVWVDGVGVHTLHENSAAQWRGRNLGVIYQSFQLMPSLSLLDNVMLPMDFCGRYHPRQSRERAMLLLEEMEIAEHARKLPADISGGQQQRVAIARALANDPAILIADEPTGRLDSATAEHIFQIFEGLVQKGKTIIMVSHDPTFIQRYARVLWIADGLFVSNPPPEAEL